MSPPVVRALVIASLLFAVADPAAASAIVVKDDAGRNVHLRAPAHRIVSLSPHATELLYEIDAGDSIVAATEYSDYPQAARRLPRIGGLGSIDIERIVALKPDLVVAWRSGTPEAQLASRERLSSAVPRSEPHTLEDIATSLERLGRLTGHDAAGERASSLFLRRIDALRSTYSRRAPVRVFYQVWNSPLMTIGGPHVISTVITLCGGRNVFGSLAALAPTVDPEAVVAADPQLIVTASGTHAQSIDEAQWSRWTGVSAVRTHRYLFVDPDLITRSTSRIADGAELLCRAIDAAR